MYAWRKAAVIKGLAWQKQRENNTYFLWRNVLRAPDLISFNNNM